MNKLDACKCQTMSASKGQKGEERGKNRERGRRRKVKRRKYKRKAKEEWELSYLGILILIGLMIEERKSKPQNGRTNNKFIHTYTHIHTHTYTS